MVGTFCALLVSLKKVSIQYFNAENPISSTLDFVPVILLAGAVPWSMDKGKGLVFYAYAPHKIGIKCLDSSAKATGFIGRDTLTNIYQLFYLAIVKVGR